MIEIHKNKRNMTEIGRGTWKENKNITQLKPIHLHCCIQITG